MRDTVPKRIRMILIAAVTCFLLASAISSRAVANEWLKSKRSVVLHASKTLVMIPCPPGMRSIYDGCPANDLQVTLISQTDGFRNPVYAYTSGVGKLVGEGNHVVWDLTGVSPGIYTATVEVRDNKKRPVVSSVTVKVQECRDCAHTHENFCSPISVICYDEVKEGTPITCKVVMHRSSAFKFVWSVHGDEELSRKLSSRDTYVSIPTETLAGQTITVEVEVKGLDPSCNRSASSKTKVKP